MKKVIIISTLLTTLVANSFAQSKLAVYATGNFGMSKVTFTPSIGKISRNFSSGIGAHLIYKLNDNINFVAMPILQQRGYTSMNRANNFDVRVTYIDIPIGIEYASTVKAASWGYKEDPSYFIGASMYAGLAVGGKYTDKYFSDPSVKINFGEKITDQRSSIDVGVMIDLGVKINKIRFGFFKQMGLKNVMPNARQSKDGIIKTTNFGFFVAYNITNVFKKK